jgi:hypothetical protein
MTRIAQARERAGLGRVAENASVWEREGHAATRLFNLHAVEQPDAGTASRSPQIAAVPTEVSSLDQVSALIGRVFLAPETSVRSVLFCSADGESIGDLAWHAAELLAIESGKQVCFVEEGSSSTRRHTSAASAKLVTRIGWFPPGERMVAERASDGVSEAVEAFDHLGERISDLFNSFDFAILHATAARPEDLVPLAREVDGVLVIVADNITRRDQALRLVQMLRAATATVLGVVMTKRTYPIPETIYRLTWV